jgi:hypothetical protein
MVKGSSAVKKLDLGMVVQAWNPSTWEAEDHKFEGSSCYILRICLKKRKRERERQRDRETEKRREDYKVLL